MKKGVIFLLIFCFFLVPTLTEAAEELEVCGGDKPVKRLPPNGQWLYQITVPAGIHLMVEMDTTEYYSDLYIKYGRIPDENCDTDDDCDEGTQDASVEIENTQAGDYYVLVDSDAVQDMDYIIRAYDASCPKRSLAPCGSTKAGNMNDYGEDIWQIEVPEGIHLIVHVGTTEYYSDLYIKYGRIPDQDCGTDDDCDEGPYDNLVEIENTQAGYYYVLVDSDAVHPMDYTINAFGSDCSGLDVNLRLNQSELRTGDTLTVKARVINNDPIKYKMEVKAWIQDSNGDILPGLELRPHRTIKIRRNRKKTIKIFLYTFIGQETPGAYKVEIKLIDPITANYYTRDVDFFNFVP